MESRWQLLQSLSATHYALIFIHIFKSQLKEGECLINVPFEEIFQQKWIFVLKRISSDWSNFFSFQQYV